MTLSRHNNCSTMSKSSLASEKRKITFCFSERSALRGEASKNAQTECKVKTCFQSLLTWHSLPADSQILFLLRLRTARHFTVPIVILRILTTIVFCDRIMFSGAKLYNQFKSTKYSAIIFQDIQAKICLNTHHTQPYAHF